MTIDKFHVYIRSLLWRHRDPPDSHWPCQNAREKCRIARYDSFFQEAALERQKPEERNHS